MGTNEKSDAFIQDVTVKSFEEIMREKRLRKQQEHAASAVGPQQAAQKTIPLLCKKKPPAVISPGIRNQENLAIEQGISHQASSPISSLELQKKSPERQNKENSLTPNLKKSKASTLVALPVQFPEMETYCENTQAFTKMPPSKAAEWRGTIFSLCVYIKANF